MTKENLYLIINTVILTALSILFLLVYSNAVPKTPEDKLFNQVVEFRNTVIIEQIPAEGNYSVIATRSRAINNAGEQIGLVYKGIIKNGYTYAQGDPYGIIEILVGITPDDRVFVQIVTLRQTSTYVGGIQNYVYEYFRDIDYLEVEGLPVINVEEPDAGATASDSTGAIKALVQRIVDLHFEIIRDQYEVWYGEGYTKSNDDTFTPTTLVVNREVVRNSNNAIIGYVYKLVDSGEYYGGDIGSIAVYIAFDIDGKVIGVLLPDDEYGHSPGNFKNRNYNYLQEFIGATAEEFANIQDEKADVAAGASNTQKVIDRLLTALSEVITG
jgi:hypothetical protein